MFYSRASQYAIRALLLLAHQPTDRRLRIREIAVQVRTPSAYLAQLCHRMAKCGLLSSMKGPSGGFQLARQPQQIHLRDIVESVEAPVDRSACVLGWASCCDDAPCPFHARWVEIRAQAEALFLDQTLAELVEAEDAARAAELNGGRRGSGSVTLRAEAGELETGQLEINAGR